MASQRQRAQARDAARTRPGVVIAYIHPGQVSGYFTEALLIEALLDANPARPWKIADVLQEWSSANVSAARNTVTRRFLESDRGEWLLWVDSDMAWSPTAVQELLAVADPEEAPIVGGLCFGMSQDRQWPTIYQWAELDEGLTTVRVGAYERDALVQVAATGAAFLLIHRRVLEAMAERGFNRAFPFFQETELHGKPVGEDLTFCIRAGLLGFPVFVHTGVKVGHHKSHLLTEETFLAQPDPVEV